VAGKSRVSMASFPEFIHRAWYNPSNTISL
jgi:hypothetical protein